MGVPGMDAQWLAKHQDLPFHEIDGTVVLCFHDRPEVYITWDQSYLQDDMSLSIKNEPEMWKYERIDLGENSFWRPILDNKVSDSFEDAEHQVIVIQGPDHVVYCAAYEIVFDLIHHGVAGTKGRFYSEVIYCSRCHPSDLVIEVEDGYDWT